MKFILNQKILSKSAVAVLCSALIVSSCSKSKQSPGFEFMPDMYRTDAVEAYMDYNNPDSLSARKPVEGTIPFSTEYLDKDYNLNLPYGYPATQEGLDSASKHLENPLDLTPEIYQEGEKVFADYCVHCHGENGDGDGPIVDNGNYPPPPSYTKNPATLTDGKIYHTIVKGSVNGLMGAHGSQLTAKQRWAVTHYVANLRDGGGNPFEEEKQDEDDQQKEGEEDSNNEEEATEAEKVNETANDTTPEQG